MAGEIKASPRNQTLGKVADKLARLRDLANKYEVLPQVPLLGGTGIGDLLMGQAPEEISNWSYGNAPMQVPEMTRIPQMKTGRAAPVADALFLGADVGALGGLAASLGRRGLSEFVGSAGRAMPVGPEPQLGVIKPKGGNWEDLQVQRAVSSLKKLPLNEIGIENLRQRAGENVVQNYLVEKAPDYALDSWIDKTLQKYVRNEMATPEDPIRLLAERGITHRPIRNDLNFDELETNNWVSDEVEEARKLAGFPKEGMAKSPEAIAWELAADESIWSQPAGELAGDLYPKAGLGDKTYLEAMPWLSKVDPGTPVYAAGNLTDEYLGFNHLLDELTNAMNPDSGLPAELLLKYESLPKVTVPQAVERVAKINEWRAKQKAEADAARAMNPATQVFKEYPEQGYKWVELTLPKDDANPVDLTESFPGYEDYKDPRALALRDALKYEGETMGHCVGGYCPDVIEGRSRIFSLRDAKGMPHVTVEVGKRSIVDEYDRTSDLLELLTDNADPDELYVAAMEMADGDLVDLMTEIRNDYGKYIENPRELTEDFAEMLGPKSKEIFAGLLQPEESIVQIKGKGNAKPKEDYIPFVQDFVKSKNWMDVGDFQNTGLIDTTNPTSLWRVAGGQGMSNKEFDAAFNAYKAQNPEASPFMTENEILQAIGKPRPFAQGGLVTPYDPARIEALVSQLMDE